MTYCVGMLLRDGLVLIADTRTNAGLDNFSSYRKLHTLAEDEDRQLYLCSAGSLSMTQSVLSLLEEGLPPTEPSDPPRTVAGARTMFRVAQLVGEAVQIVNRTVGAALSEANIGGSVSLLVGGRIGAGPPTLFMVYPAGNFIECTEETPFFQVGETKYGKPILDRGVRFETSLAEAVKVAFLSFDSAMRSNLGVARPLDLLVMPADPAEPILTRRIEPDDSYFNELSMRWAVLLHEATASIPNPPFLDEAATLERAAE
jgi:putative proteasome-type protease